MNKHNIGPIEVIIGENHSRPPFSTSLLIKGKREDSLIDCGTGVKAFEYIKQEHRVSKVFLTHYHLDHTWGAHYFSDAATFYTNPYDWIKMKNPKESAKAGGMFAALGEDGGQAWLKRRMEFNPNINHEPGKQDLRFPAGLESQIYPYDESFDMSGVEVKMIHAPGHCEGFCCPYFPEYGVLLVGDFDLTSFGPWYFNADSDIDSFIQSARKTLEIDADYYITSHQKGIVEKEEYRYRLEEFLAIIDRREEKIIRAIEQDITPEDLVYQDVIYKRDHKKQNPRLVLIEKNGIIKHLKRLSKQNPKFRSYYDHFVKAHGMFLDYIEYKGTAQKANFLEFTNNRRGQ